MDAARSDRLEDEADDAFTALVWHVARPWPDLDAVATLAPALAPEDWERLAELAVVHRIAPLVVAALDAAGVPWALGDDAPRPGSGSWSSQLVEDVARCKAQASLLLRRVPALALEPLQQGGIEGALLKGAALVDRYPAAWLRPMDDVDLYVPRELQRDAVRLLEGAGWEVRATRDIAPHEVKLVHPTLPGLPLELHQALTQGSQRVDRLELRDLWVRRVPITVLGEPAFSLRPEDELVMLAAHAGKPFHRFTRLVRSVDMAVVLRAAGPSVAWDEVLALADAARCRTALAIALVHAQRLGTDVPDEACVPAATGARLAAIDPVLRPNWPTIEPMGGRRSGPSLSLIDDPLLRVRAAFGQERRAGAGSTRAVAGSAARGLRWWWRNRRRTA